MNHEERIELANQAAKKLLEKYKGEIIYIGLYGSTARNEDKPHSDVELIVVTKNKSGLQYYPLKDVLLFLEFKTFKEATDIICNIKESWPTEAGQIFSSTPIYDKHKLLKKINKNNGTLKYSDFMKAAEKVLIWNVEYVGKFKNAYESDSFEKMREAVLSDFSLMLNWFVALVNRRYVTRNGFGMLKDIETFEKLPKDYIKLSLNFWRNNDLEEIYKAALQLWKNCLEFAEKENIRIKTYNSIEEINF